MYAVNVTIKVQNELAKKAIILALKDWSHDLFQNNGLMFRCFAVSYTHLTLPTT